MAKIQEDENSGGEGRDSWVHWLSRTILAVFVLEVLHNITRRHAERPDFVAEIKSPSRDRFFPNRGSKFWTAMTLILVIIAVYIAYDIIWVKQMPPNDSTGLTLVAYMGNTKVSAQYVGLKPPRIDYLNKFFKNTTEASPIEFKEYLNGSRESIQELDSNITCKPYGGDLFKEGGHFICYFPFNRLYEISANSTIVSPEKNKKYYRHFEAYPRYSFSICSLHYTKNCSDPLERSFGNFSKFLLKSQNSGLQELRMSIGWHIYYDKLIVNASGDEESYKRYNETNGSVIDYIAHINIRSKEEVLRIHQQEKDRRHQFIIALFGLVAIFPAVKALRDLVENNK